MKKVLIMLVMLAACLPAMAQTDFRYGQFIYKMYDGEEPYAWLSSFVGTLPTEITVPQTIPMNGKNYTVTGIDTKAFGNLKSQVSISALTLPPTVKYFGEDAFASVKSCNVYISSMESWLKSTFISGGNPLKGDLYLNGSQVKTLSVPSGITTIPDYAFANCTSLLTASIPYGITHIGKAAFQKCLNLSFVSIPGTVSVVGESAFEVCNNLSSLTIGEGVATLSRLCFGGCLSLTSVSIPSSIKSIPDRAFTSCRQLSSVSLPAGITTIGEGAFASCTELKNISLPQSVSSVGALAFANSGLTEFTLPAGQSVTFGEKTFTNCASLKTVSLYGDVPEITKRMCAGCTSLESVYIPASATMIREQAFEGCTLLKRVDIPDISSWLTKTLEPHSEYYTHGIYNYYYNFKDCAYSLYINGELLTDLVIPAGITTIGKAQFYNNIGLKKIDLRGVSTIEEQAFTNCTDIFRITLNETLTKSNGALAYTSPRGIYYDTSSPVPYGATFSDDTESKAYLHIRPDAMEKICQTAPWMYFVNIVADITDSAIDGIEASDADTPCDVYSTAGVMVRSGAVLSDWHSGLTPGIYIIRLADGTVRKAIAK